ncbi:MAG: hypothetical protein ACRC42_03135 [Mycoplasma sp.]
MKTLNVEDTGSITAYNGAQVTGASSPSIAIGKDSKVSNNSIALGSNSTSSITSISIGNNAKASEKGNAYGINAEAGVEAIAIGNDAIAKNKNIKIGKGTNEDLNSFNVFDFMLLNSQGVIPLARLSEATESLKGIVKLATEAEVDSGVDDKSAITPKKFKTKLDLKEDKSKKGIANGYASLDSSSKVPDSQLKDVNETTKGISRVSTTSKINRGTSDNTIVTPKKLNLLLML